LNIRYHSIQQKSNLVDLFVKFSIDIQFDIIIADRLHKMISQLSSGSTTPFIKGKFVVEMKNAKGVRP
jgi:hypothetical protein